MRRTVVTYLVAILHFLPAWSSAEEAGNDRLKAEFTEPPSIARPRLWWHWMDGNVTEQGIKLDLDWMHRIGAGGVQTFDAALGLPQLVPERLVFMSPKWGEAFRTAVQMAQTHRLEFAIGGAPGWSESGGPWVKPEQAMKKLVWSELRIEGGVRFSGNLPQPPTSVGPFQDVPVDRGTNSIGGPPPAEPVPNLYKDVAVIAYRLPAGDLTMQQLNPSVTIGAGALEGQLLWDGSFVKAVHLPHGKEEAPASINVDFGRVRRIQAMSLSLQSAGNIFTPHYIGAALESSLDGKAFRHVADAYNTADYPFGAPPPVQETVSFPPVSARYFRLLLFTPPPPRVSPTISSLVPPSPNEHAVAEFKLFTSPRANHFETKAGFFLDAGVGSPPTPVAARREAIKLHDIIDVTGQMREDGHLEWTPPPGRWAVLRIGYSLLGVTNHPASPEGTGLEVDKLSSSAVEAYMDGYLGHYESILGAPLGSHGLEAMVSDSWEAGPQNWTDDLPEQFSKRRAYDLHRWFPALTGRVVESGEATDRFLWDFRRTLGELLAENHYGQIAASLHARGMRYYNEAHEIGRVFIGDGMDAKRNDDVPMGAMWIPGFIAKEAQSDADIRESASVAHLYGQNVVAAESMTAFGLPGIAFAMAPETLKRTADRELADGVNLFAIHTSVHQSLVDKRPGITLGAYGQWFTRNETWAEQASAWITYLSRCSYLLQQGQFVADVLYYYGQDSNITALYGAHLPDIPDGYAFDFANAHALTQLSTADGALVTASGMRYRLLILDPRAHVMSLDVLRTLQRLVENGATIVGEKPRVTPSLQDNAQEFAALADRMWGPVTHGTHHFGKGFVVSDRSSLEEMLQKQVPPDFSYTKASPDSDLQFVHRSLDGGDIYFIYNRGSRAEHTEASFRVQDRIPELWHADTGAIEPVSYSQEGSRTTVQLDLQSFDSTFVVFKSQPSSPKAPAAVPVRERLASIHGPWHVRFEDKSQPTPELELQELKSWTTMSDPSAKYFSGTVSYETRLVIEKSWTEAGHRVELDLGQVKNLAELFINGTSAGVLWRPPFRVDVTDWVKPGENDLLIKVTNLWVNRLIGDKQPGATPVASTTYNPYKADSPLLDAGLLGPVEVIGVAREFSNFKKSP